MGKYFDRSGAPSTKEAWLTQKNSDPTVQFDEVIVGIDKVWIWTRFSGLDHGRDGDRKMLVYELGIDSDNRSNKYHGTHRKYATEGAALADHLLVIAAVKDGRVL